MSAQPQQGQQNVPTFKLVLVGDGGVGKVSLYKIFFTLQWGGKIFSV